MKNLKWLIAMAFAGLVSLSAIGVQLSAYSFYGDESSLDASDITPFHTGELAKDDSQVFKVNKVPNGMEFRYWGFSRGLQGTITWYTNEDKQSYTYKVTGTEGAWPCVWAKFDYIGYTITIDNNGGGGGSLTNKTYDIRGATIKVTAPTRSGYTLSGWTVSGATGGSPSVSDNILTIPAGTYGNLTLKANWTSSKYTISINPNGGTGGSSSPAAYETSASSQTVKITPPTRSGYTLSGWTIEGATGGSPSVSDNTLTIPAGTYGNLTLTANWKADSYSITLKANGGSGGSLEPSTYTTSGNAQEVEITPPTRSGYTLSGWTVSGATGGSPSVSGNILTIPANTYGDLTLTSTWKANSYKITIDPNGGSGGSLSATYTTSSSDQNVQITPPTREGYDIESWSVSGIEGGTTPTVSGTAITIKAGTYGNFAITPTWEGCQYTINYDLQGGTSGATAPTSARVDMSFSVSAPTKTDCIFTGWKVLNANYTSAKYGTGSDAVTPITSDSQLVLNGAEGSVYFLNLTLEKGATVTLQANWKAVEKTYEVTVEVDDPARGSVELSPQAQDNTYPEGRSVILKAEPKPGYAFECWNDGVTDTEREISVTNKLWFKANFTACVYTVTFDAKGGRFEDESKETCSVKYNETIATFPTVSRSGFRFKNWYVSTQGYEQKPFYANTPYTYTSDITVSANWEEVKTYKVEVQLSPADGGHIEGDLFHEENTPTELKAVPNDGFSFKEWQTTNGVSLTTDPTTSVCDNVDIALTAVFTGNVYTVTFYAMGGSPDKQTRSVIYGQKYGELPTATKAGCKFKWWYTEPDGDGDRIEGEALVTTAKDHKLYANWEEILAYTIAFNGMGETSGTMEDQVVPCGEEAKLSANIFEKAGHEFLGWADTPDKAENGEVKYADKAPFNESVDQGETVTLYAVWKILPAYALDCPDLAVGAVDWTVCKTNDAINGSCLRLTVVSETNNVSITVPGTGILSFCWRGGGLSRGAPQNLALQLLKLRSTLQQRRIWDGRCMR